MTLRIHTFFDIVLQTLPKCDCHLSSSSMVKPRTQCSLTCVTASEFTSSLRQRGDRSCFCRVVITIHLVFSGCRDMRLFLHQSETSVILFCSLTSISFSVFPLVSRNESPANRQFLTFLSCMCSSRSFMNMQNRRGPNILPCGTPVCIAPTADSLPFTHTYCDLHVSERYE